MTLFRRVYGESGLCYFKCRHDMNMPLAVRGTNGTINNNEWVESNPQSILQEHSVSGKNVSRSGSAYRE